MYTKLDIGYNKVKLEYSLNGQTWTEIGIFDHDNTTPYTFPALDVRLVRFTVVEHIDPNNFWSAYWLVNELQFSLSESRKVIIHRDLITTPSQVRFTNDLGLSANFNFKIYSPS